MVIVKCPIYGKKYERPSGFYHADFCQYCKKENKWMKNLFKKIKEFVQELKKSNNEINQLLFDTNDYHRDMFINKQIRRKKNEKRNNN